MGGYFAFVGNQYHLEAGSKKLYVNCFFTEDCGV
jgi:hypothetical protein